MKKTIAVLLAVLLFACVTALAEEPVDGALYAAEFLWRTVRAGV